MSIQVTFSNSLTLLAEQFTRLFHEEWVDPFNPPDVVVPTVQTADWLREHILRTHGITAVWSHLFLDRLTYSLLRGNSDTPFTTAPNLQLSILAHLQTLSPSECPWIWGPREAPQSARIPDRMLYLSAALAHYFFEYFSTRRDLVTAWGERKNFFSKKTGSAQAAQDEAFARDIYLTLLERGELWTIGHAVREKQFHSGERRAPAIHLFNISSMGSVYFEVLSRESAFRPVYAWVLNPCSAFWEDVLTVRDRTSRRTRSLAHLIDFDLDNCIEENQCLAAWGDFGRRAVKMWGEHADDYNALDYMEDDLRSPFRTSSRLTSLKQSILHRTAHRMPENSPDDHSIELIAAKSTLRQFELLRDWLHATLAASPGNNSVMLDDFGVYLPDPTACAAEIAQVFDAYPPGHPLHIPWGFESHSTKDSVCARAIHAYCTLMNGPFTRTEVMDFIFNPIVMESIAISGSDRELWTGWIGALNIVRGYDAGHRREVDECEWEMHTWRQGLDRLLLGTITTGVTTAGTRTYLAYRDVGTGDGDSLARFIATIDHLWNDRCRLRAALQEQHGWQKGASLLMSTLAQWISPNDPAEMRVRDACLASLAECVEGDPRSRPSARSGSALFLQWVADQVPETISRRGGARGTLLFRRLAPGQVLPCTYMVFADFGSLAFPSQDCENALDLRRYSPRPDDVRPSDHDRHAFLEAVVSAGEKITIFYPAMDPVSGEEMPPSPVVLQLLDAAGLPFATTVVRTPLYAEEADTQTPNPFTVIDPAIHALCAMQRKSSTGTGPKPATAPVTGPAGQINIARIKHFLSDPWSYTVRRLIGRSEDEYDPGLSSDEEPFETDIFSLASILRSSVHQLHASFAQENTLADICRMPPTALATLCARHFDDIWQRFYLKALVPDGVYAEIDRKKLFERACEITVMIVAALKTHCPDGIACFLPILRPGTGQAPNRRGLVLPCNGGAVTLDNDPLPVFQAAQTENGPPSFLVCVVSNSTFDKSNRHAVAADKLLTPWLHLSAVAAARRQSLSVRFCVLFRGNTQCYTRIIDPDTAHACLSACVTSLHSGAGKVHLPLAAVVNLREKYSLQTIIRTPGLVKEWLDQDSVNAPQRRRYRYYSEYIDLLCPPAAADFEFHLDRLLGPFLAMIFPDDVPPLPAGGPRAH